MFLDFISRDFRGCTVPVYGWPFTVQIALTRQFQGSKTAKGAEKHPHIALACTRAIVVCRGGGLGGTAGEAQGGSAWHGPTGATPCPWNL